MQSPNASLSSSSSTTAVSLRGTVYKSSTTIFGPRYSVGATRHMFETGATSRLPLPARRAARPPLLVRVSYGTIFSPCMIWHNLVCVCVLCVSLTIAFTRCGDSNRATTRQYSYEVQSFFYFFYFFGCVSIQDLLLCCCRR
jgi:hypothetical protein